MYVSVIAINIFLNILSEGGKTKTKNQTCVIIYREGGREGLEIWRRIYLECIVGASGQKSLHDWIMFKSFNNDSMIEQDSAKWEGLQQVACNLFSPKNWLPELQRSGFCPSERRQATLFNSIVNMLEILLLTLPAGESLSMESS